MDIVWIFLQPVRDNPCGEFIFELEGGKNSELNRYFSLRGTYSAN